MSERNISYGRASVLASSGRAIVVPSRRGSASQSPKPQQIAQPHIPLVQPTKPVQPPTPIVQPQPKPQPQPQPIRPKPTIPVYGPPIKKKPSVRLENVLKSAQETETKRSVSPPPKKAPAASMSRTQTIPDRSSPAAITPSGAAAISRSSFILPNNNLLTKINLPTFNISKARFMAVSRAVAIGLILTVSGFLAWDTWMTNRSVEKTLGNPASAMSVAGSPVDADPTPVSDQAWAAHTVATDMPRYLYIPSIDVRARVMNVGLTSDGNVDTPKNLNDTAWYNGSARPDQAGQVFIDGHTSFSEDAAAFNNLPKLKNGDQITIELGSGKQINYRVTTTKTLAADQVDMSQALSTPDGTDKGLTLVTCTGKFDYRGKTSDKRLIVTAVQE